MKQVTKELAKMLLTVTEHSRTSCSDENPSNGYTTEGRNGHPRCGRCLLLDVTTGDGSATLDLDFTDLLKVVEE
jgi:hypothetical protein